MKNKNNKTQGVNEFNKAFEEYFKEKGIPTEKNKMNKSMSEFMNWYNNVRKQSDTGKTPNVMHEEIYGNENSEDDEIEEDEVSDDEEFENIADKTAGMVTEANFEEIWESIKEKQKELPRKDLCKEMYFTGAFDMFCLLSEGMTEFEDESDEDNGDDDEESDNEEGDDEDEEEDG